HPGDRNVPVGAAVFYDTKTFDHIATYLGGNKVLSNDVGDGKSGKQGGVYIVDAKEIENGAWSMSYLGWADPVYDGSKY
ncbi:MAG TPA: hypothetical protein VF598_01545, partial [Hymenobacter sp.]